MKLLYNISYRRYARKAAAKPGGQEQQTVQAGSGRGTEVDVGKAA